MIAAIRQTLEGGPHNHDRPEGFVRLEVNRPVGADDEVWLMTWWQDQESYVAWSGEPSGGASPGGSSASDVQYFEQIAC